MPSNMSQNDPKLLMTSVTKNPHPQPKIFFRVQSTRLADPFEPLNSSLVQSAEELGCCKATENCCFLGWNRSTNILYAGSWSVKCSCMDQTCHENICQIVSPVLVHHFDSVTSMAHHFLNKPFKIYLLGSDHSPNCKLFSRTLWPAGASSIVENVAKSRLWISNCHSRISSIVQRNLHIEMKWLLWPMADLCW